MPRLVVNARSMVIVQPYTTRCAMQQRKPVSALQTFSSPHQTRHYAWTVSMNVNHKLNVNVVFYICVGDCCLTPNEQMFSYIMGRACYI